MATQPEQPATVAALQTLLDEFTDIYNTHRPYRALHRRIPLAAYLARPKATPAATPATETRVRRDRIDTTGSVTLRYHGRLHHIGIGRAHARTHVLLLIQNRDIRVINEHTGTLLRELVLDPTRDYQPHGPNKQKPQTQ